MARKSRNQLSKKEKINIFEEFRRRDLVKKYKGERDSKKFNELRKSRGLIDYRRKNGDENILDRWEKDQEKRKHLNPPIISIPKLIVDTNIRNTEQEHEWLRIIYERQSEHFLKDNDRIWIVTSIFIPLSLAGLSSVKDGTFISTLILAIASIGLIIFWHLTCEKHRSFQDARKNAMDDIEKSVNFKDYKPVDPFIENGSKSWLIKKINNFFRDKNITIQRGRELMLHLVVILRVFALIYRLLQGNEQKDETKSSTKIQIENKHFYDKN